jgi:hypothetical protein
LHYTKLHNRCNNSPPIGDNHLEFRLTTTCHDNTEHFIIVNEIVHGLQRHILDGLRFYRSYKAGRPAKRGLEAAAPGPPAFRALQLRHQGPRGVRLYSPSRTSRLDGVISPRLASHHFFISGSFHYWSVRGFLLRCKRLREFLPRWKSSQKRS